MSAYVLKRDRAIQARPTTRPVSAAYRVHYKFAGDDTKTHRSADFEDLISAREFADKIVILPGASLVEGPNRSNGIEALQGWPRQRETAFHHAEAHAERQREARFELAAKMGKAIAEAPTSGDLTHAYADLIAFLKNVKNESEREALRRLALDVAGIATKSA